MYSADPFLLPGRMTVSDMADNDHEDLAERLCQTLYYGKPPSTDRPSLPLTDITVEFFQEAAPRKLGRLDTYLAASTSRSACMSPCSVMVAMLYVKRLKRHNPNYLQQISSSELFLISMMMASKFMYDEGSEDEVFNDEWAECADLESDEVNQMERDFLSAIDWQLYVRQREFAEVLRLIEKQIALRQGISRGWFSYTDMWHLTLGTNPELWLDLALTLSKVMAVSSVAYLAGILTMVGSTVLVTSASLALGSMAPAVLLPAVSVVPASPVLPVLPPDIAGSRILCNSTFDLPAGSPELTGATANDPSASMTFDLTRSAGTKSDLEPSKELEGEGHQTEEHMNPLDNDWASVLSPLLALVSLKETFVNFMMAMNRRHNFAGTRHDEKSQGSPVCSPGPCLLESWSNCWNVSTDGEPDLTPLRRQPCCGNCLKNRYTCRTQTETSAFSRRHGQQETAEMEQNMPTVRCCCGQKWDPMMRDYSVMNEPFPDILLGFSTGSSYPIFVTT